MKRLVAYVSGKVQKAGYRSKVITIARESGIKGSVQNLPDGRVKVIAEGEEADLQRFADALKMRNAIIDVTNLEKEYSSSTGEYEGFYKLVGEGETDERLDKSAEYLKELVGVTRDGFGRIERGVSELGHKMDQMLDKQDRMLDKQDRMLDKQDETTGEIRGLRTDMKSHIDLRLERIEADLNDVKTALKEKGII
jgi:acylphosphatase